MAIDDSSEPMRRGLGQPIRCTTALMSLALSLWQGAALVWAAPTTYVLDAEQSTIRFIGHATLHRFIGTTHTLQGRLEFDPERQRLLSPAEVIIPVARLTTGLSRRDRAMRAMFEATRYPEIRFVLTKLTRYPDRSAQPGGPVRYHLEGRVNIRATEQPVAFDAAAYGSENALEVVGQVQMTTTMFGLTPPSVAGLIHVRPDVLVQFTSRWTPQH